MVFAFLWHLLVKEGRLSRVRRLMYLVRCKATKGTGDVYRLRLGYGSAPLMCSFLLRKWSLCHDSREICAIQSHEEFVPSSGNRHPAITRMVDHALFGTMAAASSCVVDGVVCCSIAHQFQSTLDQRAW